MIDQIAVVFPGQGSQKVGMLTALDDALVKDYCARASDVLGYDLYDLIQSGPEEKLNETRYTQPALLVTDVIMWHLLQTKHNFHPTVLAGHSLGEYAALVVSDVIAFEDAVGLVVKRATLMQEAVPVGVGAMGVVVGLTDEEVEMLCIKYSLGDESAMPANYNAPGQIVIAGTTKAIELILVKAQEAGAKIAKKLPMSVPSHCQLMEGIANEFETILEKVEFNVPKVPVIQNANLAMHEAAADIKRALKEQLYMPVRWIETIEKMTHLGVTKIIECGPGKVLTGLNKRINKALELQTFEQAI